MDCSLTDRMPTPGGESPGEKGREKMNKELRESIEAEINRIIDRTDKREERIDRASKNGDFGKVAVYERNMSRDYARLDGIDFVINRMGYRRRYDMKTGKNYLEKI